MFPENIPLATGNMIKVEQSHTLSFGKMIKGKGIKSGNSSLFMVKIVNKQVKW